MEGGRLYPVNKESIAVLDKRFSFVKDLNIGDKGQLFATLKVIGQKLLQNNAYNDMMEVSLKIESATTDVRGKE